MTLITQAECIRNTRIMVCKGTRHKTSTQNLRVFWRFWVLVTLNIFENPVQSTLGFETLDKAAALGLETATPLTDPRQYINSNLGFRNLKIWLLYSKIAAVVVSKPSGNKNKCTERPLTDTPAQQSLCFTYKSTCISYSPLSCSLHPSAEIDAWVDVLTTIWMRAFVITQL